MSVGQALAAAGYVAAGVLACNALACAAVGVVLWATHRQMRREQRRTGRLDPVAAALAADSVVADAESVVRAEARRLRIPNV